MAYPTAAVFSLVLAYAQKHRGFSADNDVPLLVAVKPYVTIPAAFLFAWIARRVGPARAEGMRQLLLRCRSVASPFFQKMLASKDWMGNDHPL